MYAKKLNEIAAAVVCVDENDLQGLARIHTALGELATCEGLPEALGPLTARASRSVERVILQDGDNPASLLQDFVRVVTCMQHIADMGDAARPDEIAAVLAEASVESATSSDQPSSQTLAPNAAATQNAAQTPADTPKPSSATVSDSIAGDPELLAEFVHRIARHLERAEAALLDLETNPEDKENINAIFRAFHTIKGTSGFLGLARVNQVAHKAETLLDRARQGQIQLAGGYADLALSSADMLRQLVECVRASTSGQPAAEPEGVDALLAQLDGGEEPAVDAPKPLRVGDVLVARGADRDAVENAAAATTGERIGQKLIEEGVATARDVVGALRTQKQVAAASAADSTLRVSMQRLDKLIDMVGELVIAQAMVSQDPTVRDSHDPVFNRKIGQLSKITRELQDLTLSMRMVPLKSTFQKMARLVRDVARKSGRKSSSSPKATTPKSTATWSTRSAIRSCT